MTGDRLETALHEVLASLAAEGREPGGSVCVVLGDEVAEAHVGTTDGLTPWQPDTLVMGYSVAKPLAALAVLSVVAEGRLWLDQLVGDLWPAYATGGKQSTTVRHVLSHQAGLPCFPEEAARVSFADHAALVGLLEVARPVHEPGAAVAEHALTYGHLCDELVRRATGERLAERFAGLAVRFGWDAHLVVPVSDLPRVADVTPVDVGWPAGYLDDPRWGPALGRPPGLLDPVLLNSEAWRACSFPAVNVHASARGLASFQADATSPNGPVAELLGADLHAAYVGPQVSGHDLVLDREVTWTLGFQVDPSPDGPGEIGMGGAGGCAMWTDRDRGYSAAYVTRGLGDHDRADLVQQAIEAAL